MIFEAQNSAPVCVGRKCSDRVSLRCALRMNNTHVVFVEGTVFYASKVRKVALFVEYYWHGMMIND